MIFRQATVNVIALESYGFSSLWWFWQL